MFPLDKEIITRQTWSLESWGKSICVIYHGGTTKKCNENFYNLSDKARTAEVNGNFLQSFPKISSESAEIVQLRSLSFENLSHRNWSEIYASCFEFMTYSTAVFRMNWLFTSQCDRYWLSSNASRIHDDEHKYANTINCEILIFHFVHCWMQICTIEFSQWENFSLDCSLVCFFLCRLFPVRWQRQSINSGHCQARWEYRRTGKQIISSFVQTWSGVSVHLCSTRSL